MSTSEGKKTINSLFSSFARYRIPRYQRNYVWNKRNWDALWKDIDKAAHLGKRHFTGAIVIQPNANSIEILDGQQRLTTFQIILCAIRDICEALFHKTDRKEERIATKIDGKFLRNSRAPSLPDPDGESYIYKLLPREGPDRDAFLSLVERDVDQSSGAIREAYDHFKQAIEEHVDKDYRNLDKLYSSILSDFTFADIKIEPDDEPESVFQTINGTGRALDEFDLLRNNLFLRSRNAEQRNKFYKDYWSQFEEDVAFWREPGVVDKFLETFLITKLGKKFDSSVPLFDQYQDYYKGLSEKLNRDKNDLELLEDEFRDFKRYADVYQNIYDPKSENAEIKDRIQFYDKVNIGDSIALVGLFILCLKNEFRLPNRIVLLVLNFFESYIMRNMLLQRSRSTGPLEEVIEAFLHSIDGEEGFSLFDLACRLEMPDDHSVKTALGKLANSRKNRERSRSSFMRQLGGRYLFDELGWEISMDKLFKRFCKKWRPAEVTLKDGLTDGLPIVYKRLPISVKAEAQSQNYKFMTYQHGVIELSVSEIVINVTENRQVEVLGFDTDEELREGTPLFAFPAGGKAEPYRLCDDLQDEVLLENEGLAVKEWLQLYVDNKENLEVEHRMPLRLEGKEKGVIEATAMTRTGHVLEGTLKSFNDYAIYMQIEKQIVVIYMNSLYELNTTEMLNSTPRKFMTDDGLVELSKYEIYQNCLIGRQTDANSNRKVVRDMEKILFDFPATAELEPCQIHNREGNQVVQNEDLRITKRNRDDIRIVTRSGHVFQGKIKEFDQSHIEMEVGDLNVNIYRHGIFQYSIDQENEEAELGNFGVILANKLKQS